MSIRRTRLLDRRTNVRDARLYIIATEGEKTEKAYFDALFQNPRVKVRVLSTGPDGYSGPRHVLDRLSAFRDEYDLGPEDELWLMIDVDRQRPEHLSPICQEATQKGVFLAISNPCFELWLYLHHADAEVTDADCKAVESRLRTLLGSYNKANLDPARFAPHVADALRRAKALHTTGDERWPAFPGTHVYKLVQRLPLPVAATTP